MGEGEVGPRHTRSQNHNPNHNPRNKMQKKNHNHNHNHNPRNKKKENGHRCFSFLGAFRVFFSLTHSGGHSVERKAPVHVQKST